MADNGQKSEAPQAPRRLEAERPVTPALADASCSDSCSPLSPVPGPNPGNPVSPPDPLHPGLEKELRKVHRQHCQASQLVEDNGILRLQRMFRAGLIMLRTGNAQWQLVCTRIELSPCRQQELHHYRHSLCQVVWLQACLWELGWDARDPAYTKRLKSSPPHSRLHATLTCYLVMGLDDSLRRMA